MRTAGEGSSGPLPPAWVFHPCPHHPTCLVNCFGQRKPMETCLLTLYLPRDCGCVHGSPSTQLCPLSLWSETVVMPFHESMGLPHWFNRMCKLQGSGVSPTRLDNSLQLIADCSPQRMVGVPSRSLTQACHCLQVELRRRSPLVRQKKQGPRSFPNSPRRAPSRQLPCQLPDLPLVWPSWPPQKFHLSFFCRRQPSNRTSNNDAHSRAEEVSVACL